MKVCVAQSHAQSQIQCYARETHHFLRKTKSRVTQWAHCSFRESPSLFLHSVLKTVSIKYPSGRRAACIAVFFGTASEYQKSRRGFQQDRSPWKGTLCHKQDSHPRLRVTLMHIDIYHTIYMHIYIYMHIMCIYMCIPFKRDFANINFTFSWIFLHFHGFFPPLF